MRYIQIGSDYYKVSEEELKDLKIVYVRTIIRLNEYVKHKFEEYDVAIIDYERRCYQIQNNNESIDKPFLGAQYFEEPYKLSVLFGEKFQRVKRNESYSEGVDDVNLRKL